MKKFLKYNTPRKSKYGSAYKRCKLCGNPRGFIHKYGLCICRRCFRDNAQKLGFKKFS